MNPIRQATTTRPSVLGSYSPAKRRKQGGKQGDTSWWFCKLDWKQLLKLRDQSLDLAEIVLRENESKLSTFGLGLAFGWAWMSICTNFHDSWTTCATYSRSFNMSDKLYTVVAVEKGVSRVTSCHDGVDNEEDMPNNRFEQFIMEYLE